MTAFYSSFYPPEADTGKKGSAAFTSAALSGYLTNENHTVAADVNGGSYSLTGAGGTFKVFNGTTDVTTSSTTFSIVEGTDLGTTWTQTKNGLTLTLNETTGVYSLSGTWTSDSESFILEALHAATTIQQVYSISKSKAGANGASAKLLSVVATRQQVTYNGAGAITPASQDTVFTATRQNTTNTVAWTIFDLSGVAKTGLSVTSGDTTTLTAANFETARGATQGVRVVATVTDGTTLTDQITIIKVQDGTSAQTLTLTSTAQSITYNANGALNPSSQTVTFTANLQNVTGTATFVATAFNAAGTSLGTITLGGSGNSRTLTSTQFNTTATTQYVVVTATLGSLSDTTTIVKLADGLNNFVGYLTNENHTVATDSAGNNGLYSNAGGTFTVFRGLTQLTSGVTFSAVGSPAWVGIDAITGVFTISDPGANIATVILRATITAVTPNVIIDQSYTITKARAGVNAKTLTISSDRQTVVYNAGGTATPVTQTTTFTANKQNTTATVTWSVTDSAGVARTPTTTYLSSATGDSVTMTEAQFASARNNTSGVIITATATADGLTGKVSVVRVQEGQPGLEGITALLTNEAAVIVTEADGSGGVYTSAGGTMKLLRGATSLGATFSVFSRTPASPATWITIDPTTGVYTVQNPETTQAQATLRAAFGGVNYDLQYSLAKSLKGVVGTPAVSGYLTNESVSVFAYANGIVTSYTPATGSFVILSGTTDISTNFTLSTVANPQALTVTYTGRTYTVSGGLDAAEDTATLTIRATGSGVWAGITIDKVFTLAKTRGGYEILSSLPGVGDPRSFEGSIVFLTTDDKLYRYTGAAWTTAVPAADVSGQIIAAQIANNSINADKIVDSSVIAAKIQNGAVEAAKIASGAVGSSKLAVGVGGNMLVGAVPSTNPNRWMQGGFNGDNITYEDRGFGIFLSDNYGGSAGSDWTLYDNSTFAIYQPNASTGAVGYRDFNFSYFKTQVNDMQPWWPAEPGKTYEASLYTGAHRCKAQLHISFFDSNFNFLSSAVDENNDVEKGGQALAGYKRLVVRMAAPANTRHMLMLMRKFHTTQGQGFTDSWVFMNRPMLCETTANATEAIPYSVPAQGIIHADQLVTNSIQANQIASNAITTSKLLVVPNGFNPDPLFNDSSYWNNIPSNEKGPQLVRIYARTASTTTPPTAPTTGAYSFWTGTLTGLNNGWSTTVPAGTNTLWVRTATAYLNQQALTNEAQQTYTFTSSDWTAAVADAGGTGLGTKTLLVRLYQRNNTPGTPPSMPPTGATPASYNFSTGVWSNLGNWSTSPPAWASNLTCLWVVYGSINTSATSASPVYGLSTPRRGEAGSWYTESGSTISTTMGVPRTYALWEGVSGPITHPLALYSALLPFSGRGQDLRLRANCWNGSNQSLFFGVEFFDPSFNLVHQSPSVTVPASSLYSIRSTIATIPSNLNIAHYRFVFANGGGSALSGAMAISDIKLDIAAGAEVIVDGSVTATKVAADAITADKIEANAITAGKIAANAVTANTIAANAILASKLVLTNRDALDPDPGFNDPTWWGVAGVSDYTGVTSFNSSQPYRFIRINSGGGLRDYFSSDVPVEQGASYRTRLRIFISSDAAGWFGCTWHWPMQAWYTVAPYTSRADVDSNGYPVIDMANTTIPKNQWVSYTGVAQFNNTSTGQHFIEHRMRHNLTAGYVEFAWEIVRAASAELIVDGAITATKIAANAIIADKIQAGAVTAAKIGVTELSAITGNVGTLTAGLIRNATDTFRVELDNGRTVVITGSAMKVTGAPFGVGNQFIEWYGPYNTGLTLAQNIAACNTNNARYYLTVAGGAYFGGSLAAGILRTSVGTPSLLSTASVESGTFGSNGGTITVVFSYNAYAETVRVIYPATSIGVNDWNAAIAAWGATADALGTVNDSKAVAPGTTTILLDRAVNNGAYSNGVSTLTVGNGIETILGDRPVIGDNIPGFLDYTKSFSGSVTYTDPQTNTSIRAYRARLTARGTNIFGGSFTVNQSQLISINTQE